MKLVDVEPPSVGGLSEEFLYQVVGSVIAAGIMILVWRMLNTQGRMVIGAMLAVVLFVWIYQNR